MDNVLMVVGLICFIMAYACYEARNDNFYRDLENKKLNVEINKLETLKGIVDTCKSLEIHLKIVRENQKIIISKISSKQPDCIKANGNINIIDNNEPRVDFYDKKKMKEMAEKEKRKQELFDMQEKVQEKLNRIRQIINGEMEQ